MTVFYYSMSLFIKTNFYFLIEEVCFRDKIKGKYSLRLDGNFQSVIIV